MPGLTSFEAGFDCVEPLEALGYESRGEYGITQRHYFVRRERPEQGELRLHVHMYEVGKGQWGEQLAFRDHLRRHTDVRDLYVALKQRLAERFPTDGDAYTDAKSGFVASVVMQARTEASANGC